MSDYAKDHSPKRGNKIGVAMATPGTGEVCDHEADIRQGEGQSGMNTGVPVKDAKHQMGTRAAALDNWKRGVTGGHAANGAHDRMPTNQETGHRPYHKPNASARANGLAMWQEGVDSGHDEKGEHAVPEQFNNRHNAK
jgi:hypothetical protein